MDTINPDLGDAADPTRLQTEAAPLHRFAREAEMIAEARAEPDAGLYVDADEIDAWIDSVRTDNQAPPPPTCHL